MMSDSDNKIKTQERTKSPVSNYSVSEDDTDDSCSLENYLSTDLSAKKKSHVKKRTSPTVTDTRQNIQPTQTIKQNVEKRTKRFKIRRRTIESFLIDENEEEKISNAPLKLLKDTQIQSTNPFLKEIEHILKSELIHKEDLIEIQRSKQEIMFSMGKNADDTLFTNTFNVGNIQSDIITLLQNCVIKRNLNIDEFINKLCERQKMLLKYTNSVSTVTALLTAKFDTQKSIQVLQNQINKIQKPMNWAIQTTENVKRLKALTKLGTEDYQQLEEGEKELFAIFDEQNDSQGDLSHAIEPIKMSLIVELTEKGKKVRKLHTLFLFDKFIACAKQRVVVLRKKFSKVENNLDITNSLIDDEMTSLSSTSDANTLSIKTSGLSRYDLQWFIQLDQLTSVTTDGQAFDEEYLRERLKIIETLKGKIRETRDDLQNEHKYMEKESKRQRLKIRKLRSQLYKLQADLVLQAPRLPLFLRSNDDNFYCILLTSEKERIWWKKAIIDAKLALSVDKNNNSQRMVKSKSHRHKTNGNRSSAREKIHRIIVDKGTQISGSDVSSMINHCKSVGALNRLGTILISGNALSGVLQVTIHEITGLSEVGSYYVSMEVDFFGQFETIAKTRVVSNSVNPYWNQKFILELDTSTLICFTIHGQSSIIGQLEFPLLPAVLDQHCELSHTLRTLENPPKNITMTLSMSFTESSNSTVRQPYLKNAGVFGIPLSEVIKHDQMYAQRLRKIALANKIDGREDKVSKNIPPTDEIQVPLVVTACIEEIERRGMSDEGLYRVSGTANSVMYLRNQFNENIKTAIPQLEDIDIYVITSLVKMFFRDLPQPLINVSSYSGLVTALKLTDKKEKLESFSHHIMKLPFCNRCTFEYLVNHLLKLSKNSHKNKMTISNLSLIWAMTLFQPDSSVQPSYLNSPETKISEAVISATSTSMQQTEVFHQLLTAYQESAITSMTAKF